MYPLYIPSTNQPTNQPINQPFGYEQLTPSIPICISSIVYLLLLNFPTCDSLLCLALFHLYQHHILIVVCIYTHNMFQ